MKIRVVQVRIVVCALLILALACGKSVEQTSQPTPTSMAYEGRLFFIQSLSSLGKDLQIVELREGISVPEVVCASLPGSLFRSGDPEPVLSPGRTWILLPTFQVVDIKGCSAMDLPFPEELGTGNPREILSLAFSPDDRYLAYSLRGLEDDLRNASGERWTQSGLYLFDLESGMLSTVMLGPCAQYGGQGTLCGEVGTPFWLDAETLSVPDYAGEMPDQVTFPGYKELKPNHWSTFRIEQVEGGDLAFVNIEEEPSVSPSEETQPNRSPDGQYVASIAPLTGKVFINDTKTGLSELLIDLSKVNNNSLWWLIGWYP